MSTVLAAFAAADPAASPAVRFTRLGRLAAAGTLVVGATFQVVATALLFAVPSVRDVRRLDGARPLDQPEPVLELGDA